MSESYDLESVYDSEIHPLMTQILEICKRVKMPMAATFCYAKGRDPDDPEGVDYCSAAVPRDKWQPPEIQEILHTMRHGARSRPQSVGLVITTEKPK